MLKRILTAFAIIGTLSAGLIACNDSNVPYPSVTQDFSTQNQSFINADNESAISGYTEVSDDAYDEDGNSNARLAAIDTANQVKWKLNVTSACVSGTAAVGFKYTEANITTPVLSSTAVSAKAGFKSFSVKRDKLNTVVLKTLDKTKSYAVYIKSAEAVKAIKAVKDANGTVTSPAVPAIPAQYKYVTTLSANPTATKAMNKAGTKQVGRPITNSTTALGCN